MVPSSLSSGSTRLAWGATALAMLLCLFPMLVFTPTWGLMDDATNLLMVDEIRRVGLWEFSLRYLRDDLIRGVIRPLYPAQVYAMYAPTEHNARALFLLNGLLVLGLLVLWQQRLLRAVLPSHLRLLAPSLLMVLGFFHFHDFFWYPSLQEKQVWVAAWLGVAFLDSPRAARLASPLWILVVILLVAVGISTKGQFLAILPIMVLVQLARDLSTEKPGRARSFWRTAVVFLAGMAGSGVLYVLALGGTYTRGYLTSPWAELSRPFPASLVLTALVTLGVLALRLRRGTLGLVDAVRAAGAPCAMLVFLWILAPRGIGGFIAGFLAPMVACCVLILTDGHSRAWQGILAMALVLAPGISGFRAVRAFARSDDMHRIYHSQELKDLARQGVPLHVPCEEGAGAVQVYVRRLAGLDLQVIRADPGKPVPAHVVDGTTTYWMGDARNCRILEALTPEQQQRLEQVIRPNLEGGFALWRLKPAGTS
ncbi:MAG: hypothetical protein AB2A00_27990 [Myxococcota bacterium]